MQVLPPLREGNRVGMQVLPPLREGNRPDSVPPACRGNLKEAVAIMPSFANVFAVHSVPLSLQLQTLQDARQLFVVLTEFAQDGLQSSILS
jgi:hypothetical protein